MQVKAYLYMALKNCLCKKKTMIKILIAYAMVICVTVCFFRYYHSISEQMNNIVNKSASECYVEALKKLPLTKYPAVEESKTISGINCQQSIDNITLILDDKEKYKGSNDFSYNFEVDFSMGTSKKVYSVPFKIDAYDTDGVLFSKQDKQEFAEKYQSEDVMLAGELRLDKNNILMSDYILEKFGVKPDENLIGSTITLVNSQTNEVYCNSLELSGIVNSDIFYTEGNRQHAQILISDENLEQINRMDENNESTFGMPEYFYYAEDYSSTYQLAMELSANHVECQYSTLLDMYHTIENQQIIVSKVVSVIMIALFVALLVSVLTVMYFYYVQQKTYKQMLRAIGMKTTSVFIISILELVYVIMIAVILGIVLAMAFLQFFNMYCATADLHIVYNVKYILTLSGLSVLGLVLFSLAVSGGICFILQRTSISEFLAQ